MRATAFSRVSNFFTGLQSVKGATKVHTVALKSDDGNTVLKQVADKTHGQSRVVTGKELRDYSY